MYYPSSFPNVRPYDPRHNTMGGPVDVPLLTTGREREIPLDLSVKTVRPTPDNSADLMMGHRKLLGYFNNNFNRAIPPNNVQTPYIDRPMFRVPPYRADTSMTMMTSPYCVDNRQVAVSTVAPTIVTHHPMMSSLLQQQPSRDNRLAEQQRVSKAPHSTQSMGYANHVSSNPMSTAGAYIPNGNVDMNKRVQYNQHHSGVANSMPPYSLFPDIPMETPKDKVHLPASRVPDKAYVNGTNGYDTSHYTNHLQRFCDQQFQQVMRPTETSQQMVNPNNTTGHYGYCVQQQQNASPCVVAGKNSRTVNANNIMNYRLPVLDPRTSEPCLPPTTSCCPPVASTNDSQNLTPVPMWTGMPMAKVVAPASSPVLKRKEGGSQKESPRTARDFPGLPVTDKNRSNSSSGPEIKARYADEKECNSDVIVIEEDNSNNSVFSVAWKQVMAELDDRQKYTMEQQEECWRTTFKRPAETEPIAPPCLEAVRPDENRVQADVYSGVPSPLGPPQLVAAVSSAPELSTGQTHIPAKVHSEESTPRLLFQSPESVFNSNSNNINSNNNVKSNNSSTDNSTKSNVNNSDGNSSNFDTSIPLPPTFSDMEDLAAMFRLRSPFPPTSNDDSSQPKLPDDSHPKEEYQKIPDQDSSTNVPKKTTTITTSTSSSSSSCGVSTPASSDVQCDTTDKFETLSDCSRDSSKPGRKRSMLECLADSEGYVAEKKKSKTTDLFADPSQLGREERALQRAMLRFEKLEKQQQGQQHSSPSRPKFNKNAKSKEVMALEADETAFPRDMSSRRTYKSAFVDFKPEVLSSRTRNQSAAQKYAVTSRKYNKNAAYEEELRREAKRLATFRAKRRIRKRLLARLFKERTESQNEHQSEEEEEEEETEKERASPQKQERPVLSQLNAQWRPYRCRRRHFRSGLDMITRQHRKKKPKQTGDQKNRLENLRNKRKQLILLGDGNKGSTETGGAPPDLKRLMVNKALGETVLHRAARMGYYEVVVYCLETKYCDVNSRDNAGYTPLHECCSRGHVNICLSLLQHGADVSASAAGGIRPIHDAVENDHIEVVRLLLSYGADPTIATYSGMTPAKLTRSVAMTEFFRGYMADAGVDVDSHPVLPWLFFGSSSCFDPKDSGYNVLEGIPSDNEGDAEEDDFIFEVSDTPHLPTYRVLLPSTGGKATCNCLLLSDVLKQTGLTSEEFKTTHGHIEITTISRSEFEATSTCSQLLTGGSSKDRRDTDPTVSVVKLDNNIREILGIETISLR